MGDFVSFNKENIMPSSNRIAYYRKLAAQCGTWAIARKLRNEGCPIELAVRILATKA